MVHPMHTDGPTGETEVQTGGGATPPRRRIHPEWFVMLAVLIGAYAIGGLALAVSYW